MRIIYLLCLMMGFALLPVRAADPTIDWNPKYKPQISRAQSIRMARHAMGAQSVEWRFRSGCLRSRDKTFKRGEWRLLFINPQTRREREVDVLWGKPRLYPVVKVYVGVIER